MPTTPYAKLLVRVNGGPLTSGGIDVVVGDSIQLEAESTVGWGAPAPVWELYGYPPSFAVPAGWSSVTVDGSTVYRFVGVGPPPAFTASVWGKYMLALRVNGGGGQLTDETTALRAPSPSGLQDLGTREEAQFGGNLQRWVADQQDNLRLLDGAVGGSVTNVTGTPPIVSSGGPTPDISITAATGAAAGSMPAADKAKLDAATLNATPNTLMLRGSSGEGRALWFFVGSTPATVGALRVENNTVVFAARNAGNTDNLIGAETDASDNMLLGLPSGASTGATVLRTRTGATISGMVGVTTVWTQSSTLADYATLIKIPSLDPTVAREVGAEAGGRLRLFVGGAASSTVVESDVTTSTPYASKILRRGSSGEAEAAWFQAGAAAAVAADGHLRMPDGGAIGIKGNSSTILFVQHDSGTDDINVGINVAAMLMQAAVVGFSFPIFLPATDPTASGLFGSASDGRLRLYVDGTARSAAIVPSTSAIKTAVYTVPWDETVRVDPSGGSFTLNLTTAVGNAGRSSMVVNVTDSPTAVTIDGAGAETINGFATTVLAEPRGVVVLESDGTNVVIRSTSPRCPLVFGCEGLGTTATTRYLPPGSQSGTASTGVKVVRLGKPRVVSCITYAAGAAGVGTGNYTGTLFRRIAGVPTNTAITLTVGATATTGRADFTPILLSANDEVGVVLTNSGSLTSSPTDAYFAIE